MTSNQPDRLDRIEALLQETVQITRSNGEAIAAYSAGITQTNQKIDALVQTITEINIRSDARLSKLEDMAANSEARLSKLEDAVIGIERILERLTRSDGGGRGAV